MAISYITDMRDINGTPITPEHYNDQMKVARHADDLGYKTVWVPEDHCMDDGFCPAPLTTLAAFARETKRIRLGTGIIQVPTMQPRRLLEEACIVDQMSNGRVTLGVGLGGYESEYKAFGVPFKERGKLMDQYLTFIKKGFAGEPLPDGMALAVPPVQRPIPIIGGTKSLAGTDRSARIMDGNIATNHMDHEEQLAKFWKEWLSPSLEKYGRKLSEFQLPLMMTVWASEKYMDDWHEFLGAGFKYRKDKYEDGFEKVGKDYKGASYQFRDWDEAEKAGAEKMVSRMYIDTPKNVAARLKKLRTIYPFSELIINKVPGIPQERFINQLTLFREQIAPIVFPETKWEG
ncbi:LLM class flavin-dependent oxidoreductase [Bradyrhizobium vignae]|uniref:LLM class flavin-dependent oxidoreductase n=1 Tax=Bradyrhizobium vignae TaxID=1549949 RepID=UPI00100BF62F|nr:LLM class flavin-dependent oxidoreductase [Bradyrhizobium vignae]RXG97225.1 LLM class flavin-dependent oxidoreductase [Bradyrhizobium vignae]